MITILTETEIRVLASLVEKALTTPEYYPLTLNALVAACNQKSNRDPVVGYDETTVAAALDALKEKALIWKVTGGDHRVPKYKQYFAEAYNLDPAQEAILCELLLRGPQTVGELRNRAERLHAFTGLAQVEETLDALAAREEPLVVKLPRQPGQKESRYAHLLAGEVALPEQAPVPGDRLAALEAEVQSLRQEVDALRGEVRELKALIE